MTLDQLQKAAVAADRKFSEALALAYGQHAAAMRYRTRQHTPDIRLLSVSFYKAVNAWKAADRAECQRQHLISLHSDREELFTHAAAA